MTLDYSQARADFEYLETLAELDDQVVLDSEREALMRKPTKYHAAKLYATAVRLWCAEHGNAYSDADDVIEIADRYGFDL